jgi:vacuolar iron transporter family protein
MRQFNGLRGFTEARARRAVAASDNLGLAEHEHRDVQGGTPRAAIFGISDGLLTNVSLILGVAGASPTAGLVRLAGLAGLVAGAFSMGAGEYISMTAQAELFEHEVGVERSALSNDPAGERAELVSMYIRRGLSPAVADQVATAIMGDPELALRVHTQEELGVAPEATGSPIGASLASFVSFAVGAFIPLVPWLFASGSGAAIASIVLGAVTAACIGVALARMTGRSPVRAALRQLSIATVAAAVTYGVGAAVGVRTT